LLAASHVERSPEACFGFDERGRRRFDLGRSHRLMGLGAPDPFLGRAPQQELALQSMELCFVEPDALLIDYEQRLSECGSVKRELPRRRNQTEPRSPRMRRASRRLL